jgi:E3 ubiquitin-protein ligase NEDD4
LTDDPLVVVLSRENDITDIIDETFTTTEERFGEMVTIELKAGGGDVPVTEENKKDYVDCVVEYRISKRVKEQFDAFMSGFSELIPHDLVTVFDERELELLIGGMSEIDVYVPLPHFICFVYIQQLFSLSAFDFVVCGGGY